jgi:hypothetical protein
VKDARASRARGPNLRWLRSKPTGASRLAFRLPIYLYRLDLGWLLGHRFLLLVHRGRRSGLLHEAVLEVLLHDPATRESVVLSARGEKADWYRNVGAQPRRSRFEPEANATYRSSGSWLRKRTMRSSPTTLGATR